MRPRSEWFQITLGLVMILLVTGMQVAGAYEYEETPDEYEYEFATPEVITSTRWEDATASADADVEEATCSCGVHTWSRVYEDDFAEASAYAYGLHSTDWVWNGPPGTAPGGSLAWTHDGQGGAAIEAGREGSGGSTHAAALAWSLTDALLSGWAKGDTAILDQLPFGRTYSKETEQDGSVVWRISKAAAAMEKARVTVRPMPPRNMVRWSEIGDPNTLGRWSAVPQVYRRYWSLRHRSISLRRKPDVREAQRLYADIRSALRGALSDDVNAPLRELLFRTSLRTGSDEAMRSSACQYFSAYVRLAQEPVERIVVELGRIGQELRVRWPEDQTRDFIRPLLTSIVDPKVFDDPEFVREGVLKWIHTQGPTWSWYEQLVRETVQEATSMGLESAAHIAHVPDERNRLATITDSEANDDTTLADGQERE